jgi:hypothetical protein
MLRKLFVFYILISFPLILLILGIIYRYISGTAFVILLLAYIIVYHPLISGLRLLQTHKISKRDFWKNFIPFWNDKYWTFLFFNK